MRKIDLKSIFIILTSLLVLLLSTWFYAAVTVSNSIDSAFYNISVDQGIANSLSENGMHHEMKLAIANVGTSKIYIELYDSDDCYIRINETNHIIGFKIQDASQASVLPSQIQKFTIIFSFDGQQMIENAGLKSVTGVIVGKIKISTSMLWVKKTVEKEFRRGLIITFPTNY
jgi:hypothetical protein